MNSRSAVLDVRQMGEADRLTVAAGTPAIAQMENAGSDPENHLSAATSVREDYLVHYVSHTGCVPGGLARPLAFRPTVHVSCQGDLTVANRHRDILVIRLAAELQCRLHA